MHKILFCFNCCGAPPSSRPARGKAAAVKSNEKLVEEANFRSLLTLNEKDQLLANQIQVNNDTSYGVKQQDNPKSQSGNILHLLSPNQQKQQQRSQQETTDDQLRSGVDDDPSLQASTSAPKQTMPPLSPSSDPAATDEFSAAYRAGESLSLSYDDGSYSPPSSIDIDSFRETPADNQTEQLSSTSGDNTNVQTRGGAQTSIANQQAIAQRSLSLQTDLETPSGAGSTSGSAATLQVEGAVEGATALGSSTTVGSSTATVTKIITSTTKIGDYARLEYSPVEDLESVTTYSQSRGGSEFGGGGAGGNSGRGQASAANSTVSRPSSFKSRNTSANVSRRSSQGGIESTSISIASQLSNEHEFQQNLTNMLESANSPIPQLFGTIGLPLGPPLDSNTTETAKTSPETTGAALTSASQDSLSGQSLDNVTTTSRAATMGSYKSAGDGGGGGGGGGALVNDSIEDSAEMSELTRGTAVDTTKARLAQAESDIPPERIDSSLSMATNTSEGLTNPTPTPSEMSGTSQTKKKSRLRAGKLFKRFKRTGSKSSKKSKDSQSVEDTENKSPG